MDIEADGASNAPAESISTPAVETTAPAPASSAREALARAMDTISSREKAPESTEPPAPVSDNRDRTPDGRFAPKTDAAPVAAKEAVEKAPAELIQPVPAAPSVPAPQRFTKAAQEAWAQAPEPIRAEVARMEAELTKGIQDHQARWEPLKKFDEMARAGGTTLDQALAAYTNMENMLRQDPVRGMVEVCKNMGIDPAQMAQALSGQQSQGGASPETAALKAEIAALREMVGGVTSKPTERDTIAQVEKFAQANPRFDELSGDIAEMLRTGYAKDLADAYAKADRLNPAPAAPVETAQAAPAPTPEAQTRKASLSITGSPASGSNPSSRKPAGSAREALSNALSQVGLS